MIRVEYTNTFDDFREAQRANGMIVVSRGLLGWFATVGLLLALVTRSHYLEPDWLPTTGIAPSLVRLSIYVAPFFLIACLAVLSLVSRLRNLRNPREPSYLTFALGWIFAAVLAAAHLRIAMLMADAPPDWAGPPPSLQGALRAPLIWSGAYIAFGLLLARNAGATFARIWAGDATLQRPKVVEVTEQSLDVSDLFTRSQTLWAGVVQVRETPNLVLIYLSKLRYYFVPKRSFPDPADLRAFVQFISSRVGGAPVGGFQVGPGPQEAIPVTTLAELAPKFE